MATPLQRQAADVIGQAQNAAGPDAHPTLSRTLIPPLSEEPTFSTGPHVTVLIVTGSQLHVALLVRHKVSHVADTVHLPGPLAHATGNRAGAPLGSYLPLAADFQLAGAGGLRLLQVAAAAGVDVEGPVGIHLPAQDLAVLHTQATCLTALRPLTNVPEGRAGLKVAGLLL